MIVERLRGGGGRGAAAEGKLRLVTTVVVSSQC
jgi:hypothetical protein